ncbi:GtrA family protein [Sphingomonadaceae bacterium G21617-S1]|jgi:putative flippase GtrA|uniref:GtrA family protein n=1 Tax=Rhizorhabdus sp. TaxID=1968843 RepID=UPI0012289963|nr:GtrA family protein [Rhizorhabdus sp.]MBD3760476.1 GtrA family protein [Rhizorhabdus sp.]MCZ4341852.1 GtrA family protein [Sphingomonadaceae bacterium G21617-S1]TAK17588.1 MAG: GtrA family protein [Rhizorhabdus sp.]
MADTPFLSRERTALLGQLLRYAITGVLASVVNIGIYHMLVRRAGMDPNLAWTCGFVGAAITGYVVHGQWSFRGHGGRDRQAVRIARFAIVSLISFGLNSLWVWLLVQHMDLPLWAPYPLVLCVTPLLVFWLNRIWVFE